MMQGPTNVKLTQYIMFITYANMTHLQLLNLLLRHGLVCFWWRLQAIQQMGIIDP